jgi:hypothetical protein
MLRFVFAIASYAYDRTRLALHKYGQIWGQFIAHGQWCALSETCRTQHKPHDFFNGYCAHRILLVRRDLECAEHTIINVGHSSGTFDTLCYAAQCHATVLAGSRLSQQFQVWGRHHAWHCQRAWSTVSC